MAILDELRRDRGLALLFITHDLELASAVCDRTTVMYAGEVVEGQPARLHEDPWHPYTRRWSRPAADRLHGRAAGGDPGPAAVGVRGARRVRVATRCLYVEEQCRTAHPALRPSPAGSRPLRARRGDARDGGSWLTR